MGEARGSVRTVRLGHRVALRIETPASLRVLEGTVWLTETGFAGDMFLRAGDTRPIVTRGAAVIEPVGTARVQVLAEAAALVAIRPAALSLAGLARVVAGTVSAMLPRRNTAGRLPV